MRVAGLFAGIGGVEKGFELAGLRSTLLCEIDPAAQQVLRRHFPDVEIHDDIRTLRALPEVDVIAAGFPCQDLSQAGRTAGIAGKNSGLVSEVFKLLDVPQTSKQLKWVVLENVPFMLQLDGGRGMTHLVGELEDRGFRWAYRIVDARAFGLPQRRQRVLLVASRTEDPCSVLFAANANEPEWDEDASLAFGFYWTEGLRGLGAAIDAVPTLKGGSTIGIPSPPAILMPSGEVVTPDIRDVERLQGFPVDWTVSAEIPGRKNARWKLVGNAVSVPVATWLATQLVSINESSRDLDQPFTRGRRKWPIAAWGRVVGGKRETYFVDVSSWPVREPYQHLHEFIRFPTSPLSARATAGFLDRLNKGSLRCYPDGFKSHLAAHLQRMQDRSCSVSDYSRAALQLQQ